MKNFNAVCDFYGLTQWEKEFSEDDIPEIQKTLKISLKVYEEENGKIVPIYAPVQSKYDIIIRLLKREGRYDLIGNENLIPKRIFCKMTPNCRFYTDGNMGQLNRHQEKCLELSTQQISSKQKTYGASPTVLEELIAANILPEESRFYRKKMFLTFDIETVEQKTSDEIKAHGLSMLGTNVICSIGLL